MVRPTGFEGALPEALKRSAAKRAVERQVPCLSLRSRRTLKRRDRTVSLASE